MRKSKRHSFRSTRDNRSSSRKNHTYKNRIVLRIDQKYNEIEISFPSNMTQSERELKEKIEEEIESREELKQVDYKSNKTRYTFGLPKLFGTLQNDVTFIPLEEKRGVQYFTVVDQQKMVLFSR
jgi:hypothetical protein